jgi:phage virion morphogenesis protein
MTGVVQVFDFGVDKALSGLLQRLDDPSDTLDAIANALVENVRQTFNDSEDPYGVPWAPLNPLFREGQPLRDTDVLMNSIDKDVGADFIAFGTNVEYAPPHQYGAEQGEFGRNSRGAPIPWGDVPARPFLPTEGLPEDWADDILETISADLAGAL